MKEASSRVVSRWTKMSVTTTARKRRACRATNTTFVGYGWWQCDLICLLYSTSAHVEKGRERIDKPRTTPPFQRTKAAKIKISVINEISVGNIFCTFRRVTMRSDIAVLM